MNLVKKLAVALIIACVGIGVSNAEFRFGIKAGLNVNNIHLNKDPNDLLKKDNGAGWTAGVMSEFQVPLIGLCFDLSLMYTRMNAGVDNPFANMGAESSVYDMNIGKNFLEIPLNIKYKISLPVVGNFISPYIFTGPSFAFKLDKETFNYLRSKTCQVAWNVGLGLQLVKHLQIGASYGFGINNVANITGLVNAQQFKVKNNYWTVTAAYLF